MTASPNPPSRHFPLDEQLYSLNAEESAFFKASTGIADDDQLKQHVVQVQKKAYAIHPYPCIHRFVFTKLKISRLNAYQDFLKLALDRDCPLFLDIGCCFGNDVRKAVMDGWPVKGAIASDIQPEFWRLGHDLFKSTPESFPAVFIGGDAFDEKFLSPSPVLDIPPTDAVPPIGELTTLSPLHGRLSAIHASSLFHLFSEPSQLTLARRLASLLSPEPGSLIFGSHGGLPEKGYRPSLRRPNGPGMFCHSPETWTKMWQEDVFGDAAKVKVTARLQLVEVSDPHNELPLTQWHWMEWSVTRL